MPEYEEDGRTRWTRNVYVIDLDPRACGEKRSACRGSSCVGRPVYVGETALTARERFAQHRAGTKSSKWVRAFGLDLNQELVGDLPEFATVTESQTAEAALGEKLREAGYCVYGAH